MKLLLYCTKSKKQLFFDKIKQIFMFGLNGKNDKFNSLNGKIVAECDYEVEEIENNVCGFGDYKLPYFETETLTGKEIEDKSCLSYEQLKGYLQNNGNGFYGYSGYAIHIKNLHIFDKPRELYDCLVHPKIEPKYYGCEHLSKAPQNMMYVELDDIKYVLISIRPEWLCKILNGEKTIEIRKKVLKEMLA